ncbi:MAG: TA system VapC family ribonuclease toxin [Chthoniobacterales bacterium]
MSHLLDVNTVLALLDPAHVFHEAAHRWLEQESDVRWITCPLVQNGVLRVAAQTTYPNRIGSCAEVRQVLASFCADSRHAFCADNLSLLDSPALVQPEKLTPSRVTDLYLLLLAKYHGVKLTTFDSRIPAHAVQDGEKYLKILSTY